MAPGQGASRALVVLRSGNILAHVHEANAVDVVIKAMAQSNSLPLPPVASAARPGPGGCEPELATAAAEVLACAVSATAVLGSATLAKGLAATKAGVASALRRDLRQLDGAAALVAQPGAPQQQ